MSFLQSGSYYPRGGFTQTIAGARRRPSPRYRTPAPHQRLHAVVRLNSGHFERRDERGGDAESLLVRRHDIAAEQSAKRTVIRYTAPTVKRASSRAIVADRLACASTEGPDSPSLPNAGARPVVDDADAADVSEWTYTAWHRHRCRSRRAGNAASVSTTVPPLTTSARRRLMTMLFPRRRSEVIHVPACHKCFFVEIPHPHPVSSFYASRSSLLGRRLGGRRRRRPCS